MAEYTLMKHQRKAVKFLNKVDGIGALLFDPGVGKTGATLAWVDQKADQMGEFRVLVIAPLTATDTWVLQAPPFMDSPVKARVLKGSTLEIMQKMEKSRNWADVPTSKIGVDHIGDMRKAVSGNRVTILSMSAGAVSSWCTERAKTVQMIRSIRKYAPHLIVVDESHIIKSATANISTALYQFGQLAPHRIILTGTVAPLSPLDVYGQWRFMAPWTFSDSHGKKFTRKPLKMSLDQKKSIRPWPWGRFQGRYADLGGYEGKAIVGVNSDTIQDLHDRVAERSMVVLKEDALDLPPITEMAIHVDLSPRENKAYKDMARDLAVQAENGDLVQAVNALAKLMKLRQIAAGFVKDTETGEIHLIGNSLRKAVKELIQVQLAGEKRVVVFAYFRKECELLAESLKAEGTKVEVITGATKADDRLDIRRRFGDLKAQPQRTVLVAQARTMSISVNELVTAQNAVFASLSERRDDWVQARGRLHRNGQKGEHVTFWNVFSPGLVGEIMLDRHRDRGDLEKSMLDHVKAFR